MHCVESSNRLFNYCSTRYEIAKLYLYSSTETTSMYYMYYNWCTVLYFNSHIWIIHVTKECHVLHVMRLWVRRVVFHLVKLPYIHFAEITKEIGSSAHSNFQLNVRIQFITCFHVVIRHNGTKFVVTLTWKLKVSW